LSSAVTALGPLEGVHLRPPMKPPAPARPALAHGVHLRPPVKPPAPARPALASLHKRPQRWGGPERQPPSLEQSVRRACGTWTVFRHGWVPGSPSGMPLAGAKLP